MFFCFFACSVPLICADFEILVLYNRSATGCIILRLPLPAHVQDLFRAGIGALIYLITSLICVIGGAGDGARIAGGVSWTLGVLNDEVAQKT